MKSEAPVHLVLDEQALAQGIDQNSPEWRTAYAMASAELAQRQDQQDAERRIAARRLRRHRQRASARFLGLLTILATTACLTTVAMFQALYLVLA